MNNHDNYGMSRVEILLAVFNFLANQFDDVRISVMSIVEGDDGSPQITATFC